MQAPVIIKPVPNQRVNERAAYGPFDLKEFVQSPDGSEINFEAGLANGDSLPPGMICTADGILTGIPGKNTKGNYEVVVDAANDEGVVQLKFTLSILPTLAEHQTQADIDELKAQIWQALEQNMQAPELTALLDRPITPLDVYYLLERWGTLTIYDAFNLDPPGEKKLLVLDGASEHFLTYDRGSCLVACPKELFSHERTLADGIATCAALAREAFKRNWTVELVGFEKYTRAAWVEIQLQCAKNNRQMEVLNYQPTTDDMKLQFVQAQAMGIQKGME